MATLLLLVIYIAFIGLGIPDSLLGAAWPAVYVEFGIPVSTASALSLLSSLCTMGSSLCSARVINRFGTARVTAVSTALTALGLFGFSVSQNVWWLCLFTFPLGLGAGAIDSGLNNYVALHYKATHMNFLHCFYGIGVSLSPYLMSVALADAGNWRTGYRFAFCIQLVIAAVTILSIPIWKRAHAGTVREEGEQAVRTLGFSELAKQPAVRMAWGIFLASCAIECTCGVWGSTFLVQVKGMSADRAAGIVTFYYVGMAIGRFLSGVLSVRLTSWRIIRLGQGIVFFALLLLALPFPPVFAAAALFLIGLGNGPVFPNMVHLTPKNFGADISQSVMGTQMAAAYVGVMVLSPFFGFLAQLFGTELLPFYLLVIFAAMLAATRGLIRRLKAAGRYEN